MRTLGDAFGGTGRTDTLLVLLPPALSSLEDFYTQGFVAAVRQRQLPVDLLLAEPTRTHVLDRSVVAALHQHVVLPAQTAGYRNIWFAGISLGAFNALHYAAKKAADLAGLYLIAPYPGTSDVLAEITNAGGPSTWCRIQTANHQDERAWWYWLGREAEAGQWQTPVYFGTGSEDRFRHGQQMLAELLPSQNVQVIPGPHAWPQWQALWHAWLDDGPLASLTAGPGHTMNRI